ncbi:MAG: hypothetical protein U9Q79_00520 [Candidatus Hydrogenedentes bacterium]|nr:hypothetical protein [Candidatus Hydrogenedentota bacterium]
MIKSMGKLRVTCECGHKFQVSDGAWGTDVVCGNCGTTFRINRNNARPLDEGPPTEEAPKKESPDHCARCGRPFRGDWDKVVTPEGVICHICANQSPEPATSETAFEAVAPPSEETAPDAGDLDVIDHDADDIVIDEEAQTLGKRFEDFRETRGFRTALWVAAISVIVLAIVATFIDTPPPPEEITTQTETESVGGLGLFGPPQAWTESQKTTVRVVMFVLEAVFLFAPTFAALFISLALADRLPGYHWLTSAVHVGIVSIGVGLVLYLVSMIIGAFLGMIGTGLAYLVAIFFVWIIYDPGLSTLITFAGLRIVFGFLVGLLRLLVYGGLSLVLLD